MTPDTRAVKEVGIATRRTAFRLDTQRLGALPLLNHFLTRLGLEATLDRFVPRRDRRTPLPPAKALGVLLRSILVERDPIYRQQETVWGFAPEAFGLTKRQVEALRDDQIGRALDRLFDADRGSLLTEVVVAMRRRFRVHFDELHNDSTTVRLTGQYPAARGRSIRGRRAPWITYGFSKDHRPDLKQLLFVLTTTGEGGVPVQFRCQDGQTNDAVTHRDTWEALRAVAGRADFLYVADSKLCTLDNLAYLDRHGGRFVTVLPRSRREDEEFRERIQTHEPDWTLAVDRPNPRRADGPRDRWWVYRSPLPSQEGWPVIWVWSSLLALKQQASRQDRIARARDALEDLDARLVRGRSRMRTPADVKQAVEERLGPLRVRRYLDVRVELEAQHRYVQSAPGRPGPRTRYRRVTRRQLRLRWGVDEVAIAYDHKSDGMYPLLTNDRSLTPEQVLAAHKRQPEIEKRFSQMKSVHAIAPVLLKNEGRIEALFCVYFLALLVQALIEREIRRRMKRDGVEKLPLYPEERMCHRPTTEQILRLFAHAQRHTLSRSGRLVEAFEPELTELQTEVLRLLGVPRSAYRRPRS
jgi:transposase